MFRQITVSAPSKVILHGEHAVVYGKTAVAASLDLRTRMHLTPISEHVLIVDFPDVGVSQQWKAKDVKAHVLSQRPAHLNDLAEVDPCFLAKIQAFINCQEELQAASLTCFFYIYSMVCEKFLPMKISVESEIPIGAGLGSSAALSVCLAAGLRALKSQDSTLNLERICQLALISEKILHGKPSGIDNAVSTYGGFIRFKLGQIVPVEPPKNVDLRILLVNSNITRRTKVMVEKVRVQYQKHPSVITPILESIDEISKSFLETLASMEGQGDAPENHERLNNLVSYNQKLLEALDVSHECLEDVVNIAKTHGLCAKLTGAGGGGFALVLLPPYVTEAKIKEVKGQMTKRGYTCYQARLGVSGVRVAFDNVECISS